MANKACNEVVTVANMPMTVFDMISAMQNKYADRVAFRYVEGKDTVVEKTYAQYVQDIRKATGYLQQELGEPKGKKIVILSRTNYEYGAVVFGTMMAGAVIVTLNQGKTWAELEYELGMVEPDLIFNDGIDYGYRAQLEALYGARLRPMDAWTAAPEAEMVNHIDHEGLLMLMFTSGTTGKSKGVMLTHGNLASVVTSSCKCFQGGNSVGFLPLNHTFSWVATIFAAFIIITYGYICVDIKNLVKDFQTHHPQNFSGVPLVVETIYKRVWKTARKTGREEVLKKGIKISRFLMKFGIDVRRKLFAQVHEQLGGNLKYIIVGGAALDPEYEQGLYDLGIQVLNGYGITECSPAVTTNTMENHKPGSVGRPLPCNEIKINDPDEDGVGEIYVRGSNVMRGYYKDK